MIMVHIRDEMVMCNSQDFTALISRLCVRFASVTIAL